MNLRNLLHAEKATDMSGEALIIGDLQNDYFPDWCYRWRISAHLKFLT